MATWSGRSGRLNVGSPRRRARSTYVAVVAATVLASIGLVAAPAHAAAPPPVLVSVTPPSAAVTPGAAYSADFAVADRANLGTAELTWYNPIGRSRTVAQWSGDAGAPAPVPAKATLPASSANGSYMLESVTLREKDGDTAKYYYNGVLVVTTGGATTTTTHGLPMSAWTLSVTGGTADYDAPHLTSIGYATTPTTAGTEYTVTFAATDASGPVSLTISYERSPGSATLKAGAYASGPTTSRVSFPAWGTWIPTSIRVSDTKGNYANWQPGISAWVDNWGRQTSGIVTYDALTAVVKPAAPAARIDATPSAARVILSQNLEAKEVGTSYTITAMPSGATRQVVPAALQSDVRLAIPRGVPQTITVTATSSAGNSSSVSRVVTSLPSRSIAVVSDATGDGLPDIFAKSLYLYPSSPTCWVYPTNGKGTFRTPLQFDYCDAPQAGPSELADYGPTGSLLLIDNGLTVRYANGAGHYLGSGWGTMRFVDGARDFSGDGLPDILAVTATGDLRLYRGKPGGQIQPGVVINRGWGAFHTFMAVGDFDGDHKNDLAASDASGRMTLFRGNGTGGFLGTRSLGAGWQSFGAVIAARDFDGDGKQDLAAVTMTGQLILYRGNGAGGFLGTRSLGYGWHKFF